MASVRQSITALYEESRKSAADGAPMMAVIDTNPVDDGTANLAPRTSFQPAIVARFEALRRLAEIEAGHAGSDHEGSLEPATPEVSTQEPRPQASRINVVPSRPVDFRGPATPPLPEEPPAPASTAALGDADELEIGDIQELVRQAWEDEAWEDKASIGHAARERYQEQNRAQNQEMGQEMGRKIGREIGREEGPPPPATSPAPPDPTDIELAMEEIASAVVQSGESATPENAEAMNADLIAAMRSEIWELLGSDLKSAIRAAVSEAVSEAVNEAVASALAEMPTRAGSPNPAAEPAQEAESKKVGPKKAATKRAASKEPTRKKTARKAAAKRAARKVTAKKAAPMKTLRTDPTPDPDEA